MAQEMLQLRRVPSTSRLYAGLRRTRQGDTLPIVLQQAFRTQRIRVWPHPDSRFNRRGSRSLVVSFYHLCVIASRAYSTFFRILEFLRFSYASRNFSLQIFDQIKLNRNLNSKLQFFIFISLSKEYLFSRAKLKIFSSLPFTTRLLFSWKIRFSVAGKWIEKKRIRLRTTTTIIQLALFYSPPLTRARIVSASMQSLRSGRSGATGTGARVAAILCTLPSR